MAQAARLNLRMQKELKLLLTDPPPRVSFPTLSGDSSAASSLTSIDARLQGPEGTVYANGVFKIKIQIPERYPFQPPIVTFSTPIYHPNIDNGGRICLDILNLPPKGMWQPSLNISTVLTSIGLLLSEPNPDDGLMHEASRDYKYNRQAFDQIARSMTEKYARAGEIYSARCSHGTLTHTGQSTEQTEIEGSNASLSIPKHRKLSLEFLGSSSNEGDSGKKMHKVPTRDYSKNHIKHGSLKEFNNDPSEHTLSLRKVHATTNKLSLKGSVASHSRNDVSDKENMVPATCQSSASTIISHNGVYQTDNVISDKKQQINGVHDRESADKFRQVTEAVIVLDSEDSEDENVPVRVRSKLSLAKRCLSKKRKPSSSSQS